MNSLWNLSTQFQLHVPMRLFAPTMVASLLSGGIALRRQRGWAAFCCGLLVTPTVAALLGYLFGIIADWHVSQEVRGWATFGALYFSLSCGPLAGLVIGIMCAAIVAGPRQRAANWLLCLAVVGGLAGLALAVVEASGYLKLRPTVSAGPTAKATALPQALLAALKSGNVAERKRAVEDLHALFYAANPDCAALEALIGAIKDSDESVRSSAVAALHDVMLDWPWAPEELSVLIPAMKDPDKTVQQEATRALLTCATKERVTSTSFKFMGPKSVAAVVAALKDPMISVRRAVSEALALSNRPAATSVGRFLDPRIIAALESALKNPDEEVRRNAALALKNTLRKPEG
jgi:hypothetical protein